MGNRAVISFDSATNASGLAIYVHWNGGRDSIQAFLKATRILMGAGGRTGDTSYGKARFIQVVGLNFPGALSFGVGTLKEFGGWNCDNGLYVIDSATMTIKDRKYDDFYEDRTFTEQAEHDLNEFTNELIKVINAGYAVHNEGATYPEAYLPTAEEWDAEHPEEKDIEFPPMKPKVDTSISAVQKAVNHRRLNAKK